MEKKYDFNRDGNITIKRGRKRLYMSLNVTSLGITGEQNAELESMFYALMATVDAFIDDNEKTIEKIFPETTED